VCVFGRAPEEGLVCVFGAESPGSLPRWPLPGTSGTYCCYSGDRTADEGLVCVFGAEPPSSPPRWLSPGTSGTCCCYSADRAADEGLVCVFGAESPGLTASLAIARHVRDLLLLQR
jgi:hypothetical protein